MSEDSLSTPATLGDGSNDGLGRLLQSVNGEVQGHEAFGSAAGAKDHADQGDIGVNLSSVRKEAV